MGASAGGKKGKGSKNVVVNRIQFEVPVVLPPPKEGDAATSSKPKQNASFMIAMDVMLITKSNTIFDADHRNSLFAR